jgi:hypothetical protein
MERAARKDFRCKFGDLTYRDRAPVPPARSVGLMKPVRRARVPVLLFGDSAVASCVISRGLLHAYASGARHPSAASLMHQRHYVRGRTLVCLNKKGRKDPFGLVVVTDDTDDMHSAHPKWKQEWSGYWTLAHIRGGLSLFPSQKTFRLQCAARPALGVGQPSGDQIRNIGAARGDRVREAGSIRGGGGSQIAVNMWWLCDGSPPFPLHIFMLRPNITSRNSYVLNYYIILIHGQLQSYVFSIYVFLFILSKGGLRLVLIGGDIGCPAAYTDRATVSIAPVCGHGGLLGLICCMPPETSDTVGVGAGSGGTARTWNQQSVGTCRGLIRSRVSFEFDCLN